MKKLTGLVVFILFLGGCASDSTQKEEYILFADYYLRYLQSEKQLKAEAKFSKGKSANKAKKLELEGDILLQKELLKPIRLNNSIVRYQTELKKGYETDYTFLIKKDDDTILPHHIQLAGIQQFSIKESQVSKARGFTIAWEGSGLKKNERLLAMITDAKNKTASVEIAGATTSAELMIDAQKIQGLHAGKGFIYLVKKQQNLDEKKNFSAQSIIEYYTDKIEFELVE